jgi:hypothetical protein
MVEIVVSIDALSVDQTMDFFEVDGIVGVFNSCLIGKGDGAGPSRSIVGVIES